LNFLQSKQIQWQQQEVQAEDGRKPVDDAVSDESTLLKIAMIRSIRMSFIVKVRSTRAKDS
jgi:hypothetical protein